ncbi:MAG: L-threonylcarbamoyladenylate synthase [Candidatus Paceibacterota bacterium]
MIWNDVNLINKFKGKGVVVMPTDTIYGVVGSALQESVVSRIYNIRKRAPEKPCIILISDVEELQKFSIELSTQQKKKIKEYWSFNNTENFRPTSIILDCNEDKFTYLHRGTNTLAFRVPAEEDLRKMLTETGPLIAPSANPEGLNPSRNIDEAKNYFGNFVDLYINGGEITSLPSRVIKLHNDGTVNILRT